MTPTALNFERAKKLASHCLLFSSESPPVQVKSAAKADSVAFSNLPSRMGFRRNLGLPRHLLHCLRDEAIF